MHRQVKPKATLIALALAALLALPGCGSESDSAVVVQPPGGGGDNTLPGPQPNPGGGTPPEVETEGFAAKNWQKAVNISNSVREPHYPTVDVNSSGQTVVAWAQEYDAGTKVVAVLSNALKEEWSQPVELDPGVGEPHKPYWNYMYYSRGGVQSAIDDNGNAFVAWAQIHPDNSRKLYITRYSVDVGWDSPQLLDTNESNAYLPQVVMNATGDAVITWVRRTSDSTPFTYGVVAAYFSAARGYWSQPQLLALAEPGSVSTDGNLLPRASIREDGVARVIWPELVKESSGRVTKGRIVLATYQPEDGWQPLDVLYDEPTHAGDAVLADDGKGQVVATWTVHGDQLYWAKLEDGTWSTPAVRIAATDANFGSALEFTSEGELIHIWTNSRTSSGTSNMYNKTRGSHYTPENGWAESKMITDIAGTRPLLVTDGHGNAMMLSYKSEMAWYSIRTKDGKWSGARQIISQTGSDLAGNKDGLAVLVSPAKIGWTSDWGLDVRVLR